MAIKITVLSNGTPVSGVTVLVGDLVGTLMTTNLRGVVSFDLTTGWEGFVILYMEVLGIPQTALVHLIEGQNHNVDVLPLPI